MLQAMLLLQMLSIATQADTACTPVQSMSEVKQNSLAECQLSDMK